MANIKIMDMMFEILIATLLIGALIGLTLAPLINITTGNNGSSYLPENLSGFNVFFSFLIPFFIIIGIVKLYQKIINK